MLIRAYRIRGHLIANLDPLSIQKKEEHPELKPENYGFRKKIIIEKYFRRGFRPSVCRFKSNSLNFLKKLIVQILVTSLCTWVILMKNLG